MNRLVTNLCVFTCVPQCCRDRLNSVLYLDDCCDWLKTYRDGYVLMATEKRQRGNSFATIRRGQRFTLFVFLKLPPAACRIPGYEINLRQYHDSYNPMETSTKVIHDKHFTTRWRQRRLRRQLQLCMWKPDFSTVLLTQKAIYLNLLWFRWSCLERGRLKQAGFSRLSDYLAVEM